MKLNSKVFRLSGVCLLAALSLASAEERVFTNKDGKEVRAEFVVATDTHVTIKLSKTGKNHVIPLESLSQRDQDYVTEVRDGTRDGDSRESSDENAHEEVDIDAAREQIAQFALANKGEQVGNGECWTLADRAFAAAKVKRPTKDNRVWGVKVDYLKEKLIPGDIIELRNAKVGSFTTGPAHTAVVVKKASRRGVATVCEQNVNGSKDVVVSEYDLRDLRSGEMMVYRFNGKAH